MKRIVDYGLLLSFLFYFQTGIFSLWSTFYSPEFYENGIAFLLVASIFALTVYKSRHPKNSPEPFLPFITLLIILTLNTVNIFFFKFSIVPSILFLLGIYVILGFYIEKYLWRRSLFIFLILILTLPLLERVQKFLGFPIRLITADIVRYLLQILGIGTISKSAVIISENHATSIDLPCSGVKSIYTGALFMLAVYYLQKVRLTWKLLVISAVFFIALLFFNTWRVFSLVYIYDILEMHEFGDSIHVVMGVFGFVASCSILWFLTKRFAAVDSTLHTEKIVKASSQSNLKKILIVIFSVLIIINLFFVKEQSISQVQKIEKPFVLESISLSELPFSDREESYFVNSDVEYSKKFSGVTKNGLEFSLLVVSSKSARTHHDPEICLQGLGYEINNSEILQVNSLKIRRLSLNDNTAQVFYWYVGKNKNLLDYSERVWEEVKNPKQSWALVIVGFNESVDLQRNDIVQVIENVNLSAKKVL